MQLFERSTDHPQEHVILGRVDIQLAPRLSANFAQLCVAFLARCPTSRREKRLELHQIDRKPAGPC